jgi:hypothetical protein
MSYAPPSESQKSSIVSEVRRRFDAGDSAGAILLAFESAMRDFEAAFGFQPPAFWTYSDIFRLGVRTDMGYAPVLLARLYRAYEPVRYGNVRTIAPGDVVETLRQFYNQPALRRSPTLGTVPPSGVGAPGGTEVSGPFPRTADRGGVSP